ncbi:MAG: Na+/H+ antiporter [Actinomycetia bacterium]|nr:Na+/H+ antiporter [Actinomycetes bacterium]
MSHALEIVTLGVIVAVGAGLARRFGWSAPLELVIVGVIVSFIPGVPEIELDPHVVIVGLLPPLLFAAAIHTPLVSFRAERDAILLLAVGCVAFTTVTVGLIAWWVVPSATLAAGLALGAVVAPPDAVAATAIARRIGMPRRLVTILEGESLINDATALVAVGTATSAITAAVDPGRVVATFVLAAGGGLLIGWAVARILIAIRRHITDPVLDTTLSLVAPYLAFLPAEAIHSSGVLAVVVSGLLLGHAAPVVQTAASRIAVATNWRTAQFLLENVVFLLIGLQLRGIAQGVGQERLPVATIVGTCLAMLVATIAFRFVWVFGCTGIYHLVAREQAWSWQESAVVSWAGMRGVVTLGAVFLLPAQTPNRDLFRVAAFAVVVGTLLIHGSTLPWLVRRLRMPSPNAAEDAFRAAEILTEANRAGLAALDEARTDEDSLAVVRQLREQARRRDAAAWEQVGHPSAHREPPSATYRRLRRVMIDAERRSILDARDAGQVDDEVLRFAMAEVDREEAQLDRVEDVQMRVDEHLLAAPPPDPDACDDLRDAPPVIPARTPGECEDCLREHSSWVHLRMCLTCGRVGCCEASPRRHAIEHFHESGHPVMRSIEPGETWRWCYRHEQRDGA